MKRPPEVATEDYLKAVYALQERPGDRPITTGAVAERVGVTAGSVSAMLQRLADQELVTYERYRGVRLTEHGATRALRTIRRHRVIESFLADVLGVPWDRVHAEAEVLEHHISDELIGRMAAKLGHPRVDPHGDPIPDPDLRIDATPRAVLGALEPGQAGTVARVSDADPAMLRWLAGQGIVPGARVVVVEKQPFSGPLTLAVDGTQHVVGATLAATVRVELD